MSLIKWTLWLKTTTSIQVISIFLETVRSALWGPLLTESDEISLRERSSQFMHASSLIAEKGLKNIQDWIIVHGGDWLWISVNIKGANKDAKIYVGRFTTQHNLLFCAHTLCMNYVTITFLLVSSSVQSQQLLCFLQGQGQNIEQKQITKDFVGFHDHYPLLTMTESNSNP